MESGGTEERRSCARTKESARKQSGVTSRRARRGPTKMGSTKGKGTARMRTGPCSDEQLNSVAQRIASPVSSESAVPQAAETRLTERLQGRRPPISP
ncbi:hypothetical protein BD414DRAFT_481798 [Trametes punicea]|nr:hypothetical protein BD414DRAFT_481798 [Trametes punicea]